MKAFIAAAALIAGFIVAMIIFGGPTDSPKTQPKAAESKGAKVVNYPGCQDHGGIKTYTSKWPYNDYDPTTDTYKSETAERETPAVDDQFVYCKDGSFVVITP
jgi:hypothetical protein